MLAFLLHVLRRRVTHQWHGKAGTVDRGRLAFQPHAGTIQSSATQESCQLVLGTANEYSVDVGREAETKRRPGKVTKWRTIRAW